MKWKVEGILLSLLLLLLPIISMAETEFLDAADSRQSYAHIVAMLNQNAAGGLIAPYSEQVTPYTLVLIRMWEGQPDFGSYAPELVAVGPQNCYMAAFADDQTAQKAIEELQARENVKYAEVDSGVSATEAEQEEAETIAFRSAGAAKMGFGKAIPWSWRAAEGSVLIGVVDSGVYRHDLLKERIARVGYDYVDDDDDATSDQNGHGTHVAGILVDCTPGLAVKLMPIRVLNASNNGTVSNTVSAIFEAVEAGCDIINLSLNASGHSQALEDAIRYAVGHGVEVVLSAGNNGAENSTYCPSHMSEDGVIVVGSCNGTMEGPVRASYSNYGASVDLYTFGSQIVSCSLSGGYTTKSGTSQAAPHASAAAAVLELLLPGIGPKEVEYCLKRLAGDGEINVPNVAQLVPYTLGAAAEKVTLSVGKRYQLLTAPEPKKCCIILQWHCEDAAIARVDSNGVLECLQPGVTQLVGDGPARADVSITLQVSGQELRLPKAQQEIGAEAFCGIAARIVVLPENLTYVGTDAFADAAIDTFLYTSPLRPDDVFESLPKNITFVFNSAYGQWPLLEELQLPYFVAAEMP